MRWEYDEMGDEVWCVIKWGDVMEYGCVGGFYLLVCIPSVRCFHF